MVRSYQPLHPSPQPGPYFVTMVTFQGEHRLGRITGNQIILRTPGKILTTLWQELPSRYPNIRLDTTVVLTNHLHAIIWVLDPDPQSGSTWPLPISMKPYKSPGDSSPPSDWFNPGALHPIIRHVKSSFLQRICPDRIDGITRFWQRDYFELYIRTERQLNAIRNYLLLDTQKQVDDPLKEKFSIH